MEETTLAEVFQNRVEVVEKISTALDGRTQTWLVTRVKEYGTDNEDEELQKFSDVRLTNCMKHRYDFQPNELKAISKILKIKI